MNLTRNILVIWAIHITLACCGQWDHYEPATYFTQDPEELAAAEPVGILNGLGTGTAIKNFQTYIKDAYGVDQYWQCEPFPRTNVYLCEPVYIKWEVGDVDWKNQVTTYKSLVERITSKRPNLKLNFKFYTSSDNCTWFVPVTYNDSLDVKELMYKPPKFFEEESAAT